MSAAEIIEQIKALPREEQREVFDFMQKSVPPPSENDSATSEPIESIATRLFDRYDPLFRKLAE